MHCISQKVPNIFGRNSRMQFYDLNKKVKSNHFCKDVTKNPIKSCWSIFPPQVILLLYCLAKQWKHKSPHFH